MTKHWRWVLFRLLQLQISRGELSNLKDGATICYFFMWVNVSYCSLAIHINLAWDVKSHQVTIFEEKAGGKHTAALKVLCSEQPGEAFSL